MARRRAAPVRGIHAPAPRPTLTAAGLVALLLSGLWLGIVAALGL